MISNGIATPTRLRGVYIRRTIEKYLQQETDKQNKQTRTKDKQNKQTEAKGRLRDNPCSFPKPNCDAIPYR